VKLYEVAGSNPSNISYIHQLPSYNSVDDEIITCDTMMAYALVWSGGWRNYASCSFDGRGGRRNYSRRKGGAAVAGVHHDTHVV